MSDPYDVLLIDGEHLLHRSAYANEGLGYLDENQEFIPTGAVYGFLSLLPKIWRSYAHPPKESVASLFFADEPQVAPESKVYVCWEGGYKHRTAMFPAYKANRRVVSEDPSERAEQDEARASLKAQRQSLQKFLLMLGITQARAPGFEADDALGAMAVRKASEGKRVLIYTGDRDLHQCAARNIHIAAAQPKGGDMIWTAEGVEAEWGVPPERVPEMKALCGDGGDNIPGCPGCGMGWAKKLLAGTTLPELLTRAQAELLTGTYEGKPWKASSLTEKIRANDEQIRISWELSKIVTDDRIEFKLMEAPRQEELLKGLLFTSKFHSMLETKNYEKLTVLR